MGPRHPDREVPSEPVHLFLSEPAQQAHRLTEQAGERTRKAVALLSQQGFTVRDIGVLTGITYQRAQQVRKS